MKKLAAEARTTHGMSGLAEYGIWLGMRDRCLNSEGSRYARYGGRGISFCSRWDDFENFYSDMGERPSDKHSIERLNNDANYCPQNCTWATASEQALNRSTSVRVDYAGFNLPLREAVRLAGLTVSLVNHRRKNGVPSSDWFLPRERISNGRKEKERKKVSQHEPI